MFIFTIILVTSEALDPIMENAASPRPHGPLSLHTISFLLHVPSHRVSSRQNNLQCARGALGPYVCISEPLGPVTTQSTLSLSQVPVFHLGSLQSVWSGLRNHKPGKGASWWVQPPPVLTCYHHHLTHSAGNPALCRRNSRATSWSPLIFFSLLLTPKCGQIHTFFPQVDCKWHSISFPASPTYCPIDCWKFPTLLGWPAPYLPVQGSASDSCLLPWWPCIFSSFARLCLSHISALVPWSVLFSHGVPFFLSHCLASSTERGLILAYFKHHSFHQNHQKSMHGSSLLCDSDIESGVHLGNSICWRATPLHMPASHRMTRSLFYISLFHVAVRGWFCEDTEKYVTLFLTLDPEGPNFIY